MASELPVGVEDGRSGPNPPAAAGAAPPPSPLDTMSGLQRALGGTSGAANSGQAAGGSGDGVRSVSPVPSASGAAQSAAAAAKKKKKKQVADPHGSMPTDDALKDLDWDDEEAVKTFEWGGRAVFALVQDGGRTFVPAYIKRIEPLSDRASALIKFRRMSKKRQDATVDQQERMLQEENARKEGRSSTVHSAAAKRRSITATDSQTPREADAAGEEAARQRQGAPSATNGAAAFGADERQRRS